MLPVAGPVYADVLNVRLQVFRSVMTVYGTLLAVLMVLLIALPQITNIPAFTVVFLVWIGASIVAMLWSGLWWSLGGRIMVRDLRKLGTETHGFPSVTGGLYLSLWLNKHGISREQLHEAGEARAARLGWVTS